MQQKLKSLYRNGEAQSAKLHSKKYGLVSEHTSLIVLEDVADYVKYRIQPPSSLQAAYAEQLEKELQWEKKTKKDRLEAVCMSFKENYAHWKDAPDRRDMPLEKYRKMVQKAPDTMAAGMELMEEVEEVAIEEQEMDTGHEALAEHKKRVQKKEDPIAKAPKIRIQAWTSNASYMQELDGLGKDQLYAAYLKHKTKYKDQPGFYFDMGNYMMQQGQKEQAFTIWSNMIEQDSNHNEYKRSLAKTLMQYGYADYAVSLLEDMLQSRAFEPQTYYDMGLAYLADKQYQKALDSWFHILEFPWDSEVILRFPWIENIVLADINALITAHRKELDIRHIPPCLQAPMPVDIRIVIDWNTDNTDIDLWVTDPLEETCSYRNRHSYLGGFLSNDITQGYGPEAFWLKHAPKGTYSIRVHLYANHQQKLMGNTSVRAMVYTHFGSKKQQMQYLSLQLNTKEKGDYLVGDIVF
ncbi:MAG: DUF2135 domain-containing protein [Flavobacteriaceae bacterium]|nr:DUF2135 domain-containing protein [Flavobacteriaceae bacterium]